jgi:hypothetical protein
MSRSRLARREKITDDNATRQAIDRRSLIDEQHDRECSGMPRSNGIGSGCSPSSTALAGGLRRAGKCGTPQARDRAVGKPARPARVQKQLAQLATLTFACIQRMTGMDESTHHTNCANGGAVPSERRDNVKNIPSQGERVPDTRIFESTATYSCSPRPCVDSEPTPCHTIAANSKRGTHPR